MIKALVDSIVRDVWAYPEADRQFVYRPVQMTDKRGAIGAFVYPQYALLDLPNNTTRYMVYELGAIDPQSLGILGDLWAWKSLTSVVSDSKFIFQMFINHEMLSLDGAYIKRTERNSLAVIVPYDKHYDLLVSKYDMYFRFYSNAYYAKDNIQEIKPLYRTLNVSDNGAVATFLTELAQYDASGKTRLLTLNNKGIDTLDVTVLQPTDTLQCWYDESLIGHTDTMLNDFGSYTSEDGMSYYIFQNDYTDAVYYMDDVEFYLVGHMPYASDPTKTREVALFIPRFKYNSIKMLSYCDYAINTDYIDAIRAEHPEIDFTLGLIRAYVRKNEHGDVIINDASMQLQFYQLPKETRLALMTGPHAGISFWQAKQLEKSPYATFMSLNSSDAYARISNAETIGNIYNYFGLMELLEQNHVIDALPNFSVIDSDGALAFYYDISGKLYGYAPFSSSEARGPIPMPVAGVRVETIAGRLVTKAMYNAYDPLLDNLSELNEERYFINPAVSDPSDSDNWERALVGSEFDVVGNDNRIEWHIDLDVFTIRKKRSTDVFFTNRPIARADIGKKFRLTHMDSDTLSFDPGFANADFWLNSFKLVEEIDYSIDYPYITIFNTSYLKPDDSSILTYRLYGLHDTGDEPYPNAEVGFIEHGMISRDETFDIYKNVNSRIFIGGCFTGDMDVKSGENGTGTTPSWVRDGMPYSIEPIVSQIDREFIQMHTEGRAAAYGKIQQAEAVLTTLLPQVKADSPVIIQSLYQLVSPLAVLLIDEVELGNIKPYIGMPDSEVMVIVSQYVETLNIDPAYNRENDNFCSYIANALLTPRTVSPATYAFIEQVSAVYMEGQLQVSTSLQIGA